MFTRKRLATWLGVLGAIALFLAVQPYFRGEGGVTADAGMAEYIQSHPDSIPLAEEYRFGWAESPLVRYRSDRTLVRLADGGYRSEIQSGLTVGWVSWSSLTLATGLGLLWAGKRMRPAENAQPPEPVKPRPGSEAGGQPAVLKS